MTSNSEVPTPPTEIEMIMAKVIWHVEDIVIAFGLKSNQVVYKWNQTDGPPRYKIGKYVLYKRDEVLAWFDSRKTEDR